MGIALWLSPSSPTVSSDLEELISSLASKYGTPRFPAHVTLLSGIPTSTPLAPLVDALRVALSHWRQSRSPPLSLSLTSLGTKAAQSNFFQYLFAQVDPSNDALLALRRATRDALLSEAQKERPDDYFPHLSLMYGVDDSDKSARDIIEELQRRDGAVRQRDDGHGGGSGCAVRGHDGFEVTEVQVWSCEGPPEAWQLLATERL